MDWPLLRPGAGAPVIWMAGKPLKRLTTFGPARNSLSTTPDSGTIWPCALRMSIVTASGGVAGR